MNSRSPARIELDPARPEAIFDHSITEIFSCSNAEIEAFQLAALQRRFEELRPKIAVLDKLAEGQGIDRIRSLEDGPPLLLQHSTYKAYPLSIIEKGQFDRLTRWLGNLTTHDLAHVNTAECTSIDEWLDILDRDTPLRLVHSSGTSGKLSFVPRSKNELPTKVKAGRLFYEGYGNEPNTNLEGYEQAPGVYTTYRKGAAALARSMDANVEYLFGGNENMIYTLYPGRMSADVLTLGGRLQAADAKGGLDKIKISPSIKARRDEFLSNQAEQPLRMKEYLQRLADELSGRQVTVNSHLGQLLDFATAGEAMGIKQLFSPKSFMMAGGGLKGRVFPPDWERRIQNFFGMQRFQQCYGMSEMITALPACAADNYHLHPSFVPYILDPKSGEQAPRHGTHTGRFGVMDLIPRTYWGGFLSGDEVTLSYGDVPCSCGRIGAYVHTEVRRYTEKEGGDDKINCAGAPQAHADALAYLALIE